MVDKGSSLSSSSAPRTTVRRTNRFGARTAVRTHAISRTPIVLEINHSHILRVGYAEQSKPHHTLLLNEEFTGHDNSKPFSLNQNLTDTQWYNVLSPIITRVYDRLMCNPTTRRVVCVLPHLASDQMIKALKKMLSNKGVPAVAVWSNLEILPVAQGWKRGLIVHVSKEETVSVCHSDGHVLPYTYQSVPVGYGQLLMQKKTEGEEEETNKENQKLQLDWTSDMDDLFLNENNPNSAVIAVLKTMEDCPRDVRHNCISNIVFAGEGVVLFPDLSRRVIQRVKSILEGSPAPLNLVVTSPEQEVMTHIPVATKSLATLAPKLQLVSTHPYRPDWVSWVGASLWAAAWNKYDDEESGIKWKFAAT